MNEWWNVQQSGLIGGLVGGGVGVLGAVLGVVMALWARQGKLKPLVYAIHFLGMSIGLVSAVFAGVALAAKQPYHVWYPLAMIGVLGVSVFGVLFFALTRRVYAQAEHRRLDAALIRGA